MNAARAIRHLEDAGFSHQQAAGVVEIIEDDVLERIATKDFVELTSERVKSDLRAEIHDLRAELKSDIHDLRAELKTDIQELRTELKTDIQELRTELKGDIQELRTELKGDIQELRIELKNDIHGLRTELKKDIYDLDGRFRDRHLSLVKWLCGIAIVQTASIIFGAASLIQILK